MPRTKIRSEQGQDISFVSEAELNQFLDAVVITGTENATTVVQLFDDYFPGRGLIVGVDGNVVVTGTQLVTISGFRDEFLSASGTLVKKTGDTMTGNLTFDSDSVGLILGDDQDAKIFHDGTNLQIENSTGFTGISGAIFVAQDGDGFSQFGPVVVAGSAGNDNADILVSTKLSSSTTGGVRRGGTFTSQYIGTAATSVIFFGLNAFASSNPDAAGDFTATLIGGGLVGGRYASRHHGDGNIVQGGGVSVQPDVRGNEAGTYTNAYGYLDEGGDGGAGIGGMTNYQGLWIRDSLGNVTNKTGILIEDLNNASTNIGIRIDGASTNALWLGAGSPVTTAADGITFGSGKDVNLYRSADDTLKTDDDFLSLGTITATTITGTTGQFGGTVSAQTGDFSHSLTISGIPVNLTGGGGTSDHSALNNLDFASAGHTGFASSADTDALAASGVATDANIVSVSGHLQGEIDATQPDVDALTVSGGVQATGVIDFVGSNGVNVSRSGQIVTFDGAGVGGGGGGGNINDINAETGPSITITGTTGVNTSTAGGVITLTSEDSEIDHNALLNFRVEEHFEKSALEKNIAVEHPNSNEDLSWFRTSADITITNMHAVLEGSAAPSVTLSGILHDPSRISVGNNVISSGVVVTSQATGHDIPLEGDVTIPGGSWVWLETSAESGTVDNLLVSITYTED